MQDLLGQRNTNSVSKPFPKISFIYIGLSNQRNRLSKLQSSMYFKGADVLTSFNWSNERRGVTHSNFQSFSSRSKHLLSSHCDEDGLWYNRTNIRFDIDQLKVKLNDKKTSKSTTVQTVELTPEFTLDSSESFHFGYRNVIVVKKMTFPNDKVLTIELSEKQISGRTISLDIDYEDVLYADSFNSCLMMEE